MIFFNSFKQILLMHKYTVAVQSMAMFAIGNLSHAIVTATATAFTILDTMYDMDILLSLTELCLQSMSNPNEKLATNAVRTTGYMTGIILRYHCQLLGKYDCYRSTTNELLQRVTKVYVAHIRSAVALGSSLDTYNDVNCSWKQKMAIKKKGWGSCNALSFLLERNILTELCYSERASDIAYSIGKEVVSCLVECIESLNIVHEKIVISASIALRSISDISSLDDGDNDHLLGRVMVACCTFVFANESIGEPKPKHLLVEIDLLLSYLLSNCTMQIVQGALKLETFVFTLPQLFKWMVKQNSSPSSFECFAISIAMSGLNVDVEVEQQFMNHFRSHGTNIHSDLLDEI
jgi:hypothetical protein